MLNNKVIVVTGGAGLLGSTFCESILKNKGTPIIADIDEKKGKHVERILREKFIIRNNIYYKLDITSKKSIDKFINNVCKDWCRIDALVNNAYPRNSNYGRDFLEEEYKDFCENVNIHLGGYFLMCQQMGIYFKKEKKGNIVNMSSIYGVIPPRFEVYNGTRMTMPIEYAVIKSGVIHLTKYLAKYFRGHNIRINSISPGGIFDNQPKEFLTKYKNFCMNKGMLDKNDITGTLIFLLSDKSKYINGQNIIVDDGYCL